MFFDAHFFKWIHGPLCSHLLMPFLCNLFFHWNFHVIFHFFFNGLHPHVFSMEIYHYFKIRHWTFPQPCPLVKSYIKHWIIIIDHIVHQLWDIHIHFWPNVINIVKGPTQKKIAMRFSTNYLFTQFFHDSMQCLIIFWLWTWQCFKSFRPFFLSFLHQCNFIHEYLKTPLHMFSKFVNRPEFKKQKKLMFF
jgi:hypothetical protein